MGQRVAKIVKYRTGGTPSDRNHWRAICYIRDDSGKVMSTYEEETSDIIESVYSQSIYKYSFNYYPYGMVMDERHFVSEGLEYRYGFQNQEEDNELWSGAVSYKYRVEDPRLGWFFSVDPLASKYPHNSVYAFSENRLLDGIELEGLEWQGLIPKEVWASAGIRQPYNEIEAKSWAKEGLKIYAEAYCTTVMMAAPVEELAIGSLAYILTKSGVPFMKWSSVIKKANDIEIPHNIRVESKDLHTHVQSTCKEFHEIVDEMNKTIPSFEENGINVVTIHYQSTDPKMIIIGRGQDERINVLRDNLNSKGWEVETYDGWNGVESIEINQARNKEWIDGKLQEGYSVIDIGLEPIWVERGSLDAGNYYPIETQAVNAMEFPGKSFIPVKKKKE